MDQALQIWGFTAFIAFEDVTWEVAMYILNHFHGQKYMSTY